MPHCPIKQQKNLYLNTATQVQERFMLKLLKLLLALSTIFGFSACKCVPSQKSPKLLPNSSQQEVFYQAPRAPFAEALAYAQKNLPHVGTLIQKPDGYAYIKVDDRYINELFPLLNAPSGYEKPPYFRRDNLPGAHISVVYKNEKIKLKEAGQKFSFTIRDITTVSPNSKNSYIILQVDAPELENLRKRYKLGAKLNGHEFHISLAKKTTR